MSRELKNVAFGKKNGRLMGIAILILLAGLAALWRWSPLANWVEVDKISQWMDSFQGHPMSPFVTLAAYLLGGLIMFPITLLIVATAFVFGPVLGFAYSLVGSVSAAALTYSVGYLLGRKLIRQIAGAHMARVRHAASRHGMMASMISHLIPIAPFTIVNLIAGASRIRFRDFALGTTLGMAPGITAITLFEHQLESAIRNPGPESFVLLAALAALTAVAMMWARRQLAGSPGVSSKNRKCR